VFGPPVLISVSAPPVPVPVNPEPSMLSTSTLAGSV
jgi:hypothetical protein